MLDRFLFANPINAWDAAKLSPTPSTTPATPTAPSTASRKWSAPTSMTAMASKLVSSLAHTIFFDTTEFTMNSQPAAPFQFDFFQPLPIHIQVADAPLTSDAGLLPLRQFDQRIGLTKQF